MVQRSPAARDTRPVKASRPFQVFVKPIGPVCNLECRYCYYLEKRDLYPGEQSFRLDEDLLERYIVQHLQASSTPSVLFSWHGGEPTLLGIDYFRTVLALQEKHRGPGQEVLNGIQTNGTLLDESWCRFFAEHGFYVGLSLDGPKELHDGYRLAKGQKPTFDRVVDSFRMLRRHDVHCDVLCVLHEGNVRHPLEVYRFFKTLGVRHLVFLPLVMKAADGVTAESVPADGFGEFLCTVFDEWVRNDMQRIYVQMLEEATRPARGMEHSLCVLRRTCGELPILEHNGDFYSCDHFVDPAHRLGNLREHTLLEVLEGEAQQRFGRMKWETLPGRCRSCKVLEYCNGGCPKDRIAVGRDGEMHNYLCPGLQRFFTHVKPTMNRLAAFLKTGQPVEQFMAALRGEDRPAASVGRNDPCPCGSGRKYKHCCLGRPATPFAVLKS